MHWKVNFILITFLLLFCLYATTHAAPRYYLHSGAAQTITPVKQKVLDTWISFLYEEDDIKRQNFWDPVEIAKYKTTYCLFEQSFFQFGRFETLGFARPYVLSIENNGPEYFITTEFSNFPLNPSDSSVQNQSPMAIIKVAATEKDGKVLLKNMLQFESKFWDRYKSGSINYFVEPGIAFDSSHAGNASAFLDSLSIIWRGSKYIHELDYYVGQSPESVNRLLGFTFAFLGGVGGGIAYPPAALLFSGNSNFFYKHELAHIALGAYPNTLFSEGLATLYAGSNGVEFSELKRRFLEENPKLTIDVLEKMLSYTNSREYYIVGALLLEHVRNTKGIQGLKSLASAEAGSKSSSDAELLTKQITDLLETTTEKLIKGFYK